MLVSERLSEADIQAALECLAGGWLTMGPRVAALEASFAAELGAGHAVAVSSGGAALQLACIAAGAAAEASVVVSALAGPEAVNAPRCAGASALRADVLEAAVPALDAEPAADGATVAVICSHLAGVPADVAALADLCSGRGWTLIEDVTEGLGARLEDGRLAGTAGAIGCFSLGAGVVGVGEGGMVVTDDERLAARVRSLRSHAMTSVTWDRHRGHADSYDIVDVGFNFRLDEPRAALAHSRLARLGSFVAGRRKALEEVRRAARGARLIWDDEAALARAAPTTAPLRTDDARVRAALSPHAHRWPDAFVGIPGARPAPVADVLRRQSLLVDLDAAQAVAGALSQAG